MAGAYTPEQLAMLERQVAHFASDDHIRREVDVWRDATPEERLAALVAMSDEAEQLVAQLPADVRDRPRYREPLPDESVTVLSALRKLPR